MSYEFKIHSISYKAIDPAELFAREAEIVLGFKGMGKVIRHRASVDVEYLIEMSDGTRHWQSANADYHELDDCSRCHGMRGGVKGNENIADDGSLICDHCEADDLLQKQPTVETQEAQDSVDQA